MSLAELTFADFIRFWARVALLLVFVEAYLTVNKIWTRKHEAVVSESVSIWAQLIALLTGVPFVALYALDGTYEGAVADGVFLVVNVIMILIGIGLWVEGHRGESVWTRFRRAMRLERSEASNLLKDMFRPAGAEQVIAILHALAMIDDELDAREQRFVAEFAQQWGVNLPVREAPKTGGAPTTGDAYVRLRGLVEDYLATSPPREQALHLIELMSSLINIDGAVSGSEALIMGEINGLLAEYAGDAAAKRHVVFIAPQNDAQEQALRQLMPHLTKEIRLGGEVFRIGSYYSAAYAAMICERYRSTGYLTINVEEGANADTGA